MTSGPDPVYDAFLKKNITNAGHDKARAFGYSLVSVIEAAERVLQRHYPVQTNEIERH